MQKSRAGSPPSPRIPPPPKTNRSSKKRHGRARDRDRDRDRAYSLPRSKSRRSEVTITLCVFHTTSHNWSTEPFKFDPNRTNDRELWMDIRTAFRMDLQKPWRRIFGFKKVKSIVPIGFTSNGVPVRTDPKDFPDVKQFMHAYHHPDQLRPEHRWVDWFVEFDASDRRPNGLEFVEGLWADKLAGVAVIFSVAIIITSVIWVVKGGDLQTVFTVMGFVLTFAAGCSTWLSPRFVYGHFSRMIVEPRSGLELSLNLQLKSFGRLPYGPTQVLELHPYHLSASRRRMFGGAHAFYTIEDWTYRTEAGARPVKEADEYIDHESKKIVVDATKEAHSSHSSHHILWSDMTSTKRTTTPGAAPWSFSGGAQYFRTSESEGLVGRPNEIVLGEYRGANTKVVRTGEGTACSTDQPSTVRGGLKRVMSRVHDGCGEFGLAEHW